MVLGDETFVGAQAVITSGVKVYPFKTVEAGAIVNTSIVWESRGPRSLFGRSGVTGLANVDISPELAMRLSMAWASNLERGSTVTTSRDTSRAARVLKRAVIVGCNAAGVNVDDLEVATVPVTRFQVALGLEPGRASPSVSFEEDAQSVMIRFFDEDGIDVAEATQRKIERLYHREEFRRALASEIGDIEFPPRALELYTAALSGRRHRGHRRRRVQAGPRLLLRDLQLRHAQRPGQAGGRGPRGQPLRGHGRRRVQRPGRSASRVADLVRASGAQVGAVIDPGGEHITLVDGEGRVLTDDEALLLLLDLVVSHPRHEGGPAGGRAHGGRTDLRGGGGRDRLDQAVGHPPHGGGQPGGVTFAASQMGGSSSPASSPPSTPWPPWSTSWACWPRTGERLSKLTGRLPTVHIAHEEVVTPWEQKGTVMRIAVERTKDRPVILVDGVKIPEPDGGSWSSPTPRNR